MEICPLDRDFIQTGEKFFFCIVGYVHPPDRIVSYLKYIPADSGKWKLGNQALDRVLPYYSAQAVLNTFEFLKKNYPQYIFFDASNNIEFSAVPYSSIKKYYSTREKLREIFQMAELDPLQIKLKSFVTELARLARLERNTFGITGSILLNIHNATFSDLDVTIHGLNNSRKLKQTLQAVFEAGHDEISPLDDKIAKKWQDDKIKRFGIREEEAIVLFKRKWNMGLFQNTRFSIHPIRNVTELSEKYGDKSFTQLGEVTIKAKVIDDSEALFLPAKYEISQVKIIAGKYVENIKEIISYEGLFDSIAEKNELIIAKGQLELVNDKRHGIMYYRVVIGSRKGKSEEFLTVIRESFN
ncbi:MAG: hypothetical protein ACTSQI_05965 [Candidatus Helarchaeota archaeon]